MSTALVEPSLLQRAKDCSVINELEEMLAQNPCPPPPVIHRFTPGLYSRQITMPAGLVCTSKIHRTEHQFLVSRGHLKVWAEETGWVEIIAPFHGITKPGARRILAIAEETVWTTFHPTDATNAEDAEAELIEPHPIPIKAIQ